MTQRDTGPDIEQYIETRLNLLTVLIDKLEASIRERIDAVDDAAIARFDTVEVQIAHTKEITQLLKEASTAAALKSEAAQHAVNLSSNEWRNTVQIFKDGTTSRTEFEKLAADFSAYKLEIATTIAARQREESGVRQGAMDNRTESRSSTMSVVGIAVGAATLISILVGAFIRAPTPAVPLQAIAPAAPTINIPPGYTLVPSSQAK